MIRFLNGGKMCDKRGKNKSISAINEVQKAPLRLLFLVKSNVFCLQFVLIAIFVRTWVFTREYLAKCTVGPDF